VEPYLHSPSHLRGVVLSQAQEQLYLHASFEAFTAVMFEVEVIWVVTPCSVVVDGGSMDL